MLCERIHIIVTYVRSAINPACFYKKSSECLRFIPYFYLIKAKSLLAFLETQAAIFILYGDRGISFKWRDSTLFSLHAISSLSKNIQFHESSSNPPFNSFCGRKTEWKWLQIFIRGAFVLFVLLLMEDCAERQAATSLCKVTKCSSLNDCSTK